MAIRLKQSPLCMRESIDAISHHHGTAMFESV